MLIEVKLDIKFILIFSIVIVYGNLLDMFIDELCLIVFVNDYGIFKEVMEKVVGLRMKDLFI